MIGDGMFTASLHGWIADRKRGATPAETVALHFARSCHTSILFFALTDLYVEADHSVLVTGAEDRDVFANVVLALDNLLRSLRHVLTVSKCEVVRDLLLDGDLGTASGVGFGVEPLRVDFYFADAE